MSKRIVEMATAAKAALDNQDKAIEDHTAAQSAANGAAITAEENRGSGKRADLSSNLTNHYNDEADEIAASKQKTVSEVANILGVSGTASESNILGLYEIAITKGATLDSKINEDVKTLTSRVDDIASNIGEAGDFVL